MAKRKQHKYYKKHYMIVFYDKDDETLLCEFDNVPEILEYKGLECTPKNIRTMHLNILRALTWRNHRTHCLTGKLTYVYLVDIIEEE